MDNFIATKGWQMFANNISRIAKALEEQNDLTRQTLGKDADAIPINWIRNYARDCGPEGGEILEYMISVYKSNNTL